MRKKKQNKTKRPNEKDLEFLAYGIQWPFDILLPNRIEARKALISEIIELWEKIREE